VFIYHELSCKVVKILLQPLCNGTINGNSEVVNGVPAGRQVTKREGKNGKLALHLSAKTAAIVFSVPRSMRVLPK
jgi:hypothetical protein